LIYVKALNIRKILKTAVRNSAHFNKKAQKRKWSRSSRGNPPPFLGKSPSYSGEIPLLQVNLWVRMGPGIEVRHSGLGIKLPLRLILKR
jgi:hypothetical protein